LAAFGRVFFGLDYDEIVTYPMTPGSARQAKSARLPGDEGQKDAYHADKKGVHQKC
jgi:hypothetical protein